MPKIYTKTGDGGETDLYDGSRLAKTEAIFDVLGTLDELSSHIGVLITICGTPWLPDVRTKTLGKRLREIQQTLLDIGSIIATPNPVDRKLPDISGIVESVESFIDGMESLLPALTTFLLVGGQNTTESQAHVCRTVARRAEREFLKSGIDNDTIRIWLNRISDYFFTLARIMS
jgi:cob(I)alamin adenosyltransferase